MSAASTRRPPFDPAVAAAIKVSPFTGSVTPETIGEFRGISTVMTDEALTEGGGITIEERTIPADGNQPAIELVVLRPDPAPTAGPGVVAIHGGGMIGGSNRSPMAWGRHWVREGVTLVSVGYRRAPEHPFPAAHDDCCRALRWVSDHGPELGIDPDRVLLAGASAGGGLTLSVALRLRDEGLADRLVGVLALCPMIDDRNDSVSVRQLADGGVWDSTSNRTGWSAYLGSAAGGPEVPAYAAPARATDLSGLPPVFLDVGTAEIFRSEVVDFAGRLWADGADCELHVWPGGCHGYDVWAPQARITQGTIATRDAWALAHLGVR